MNKRWVYVSLIVNVFLLFCMLFWIWPRDRSDRWNLGREEKDPDFDREAVIENIKAVVKKMAASTETVEFYGKFIDQHGDPVKDVKFDIELEKYNDRFIEELNAGKSLDDISFDKKTNIVRYTDENGLLTIKELGTAPLYQNSL